MKKGRKKGVAYAEAISDFRLSEFTGLAISERYVCEACGATEEFAEDDNLMQYIFS